MEKRKNTIRRIALIGPESTGKTTLATQLASHYNTLFVPEFSRLYVPQLTKAYTLNDIIHMTREQLKEETKALETANDFLFVDTELIIAKIWCEDVFKTCPQWIDDDIEKLKYDHYLLTSPDIPWVADPIRENPKRRDYFFDLYKAELDKRGFSYSIISGTDGSRIKNAIKAIEIKFGI